MDDSDLARLAVVYLTAVHEGRSPIETLQDVFDLGEANARRYARLARGAGLLPRVGKGEVAPAQGHWPRTARLLNNRGARWVVCQECHQPWPCRTPDTLRCINYIAECQR